VAKTVIDQAKILEAQMSRHQLLPARSNVLVERLNNIFDDTETLLVAKVMNAVHSRIEKSTQGTILAEDISNLMAIRRDPKFKQSITRISNSFSLKVKRRINDIQTKVYKDTMTDIAKIWNENTPESLKFTVDTQKKELKTIHRAIFDGYTIHEHVDIIVKELEFKVIGASTAASIGVTGESEGLNNLRKRVRYIFGKTRKRVENIAKLAVNQANAEAYESERLLFESDDSWAYN